MARPRSGLLSAVDGMPVGHKYTKLRLCTMSLHYPGDRQGVSGKVPWRYVLIGLGEYIVAPKGRGRTSRDAAITKRTMDRTYVLYL